MWTIAVLVAIVCIGVLGGVASTWSALNEILAPHAFNRSCFSSTTFFASWHYCLHASSLWHHREFTVSWSRTLLNKMFFNTPPLMKRPYKNLGVQFFKEYPLAYQLFTRKDSNCKLCVLFWGTLWKHQWTPLILQTQKALRREWNYSPFRCLVAIRHDSYATPLSK